MANNVFQAKRTNVSGRTPNTTGSYATNSQYIAAGEFALNMADGILYSSNGSAVITVGSNIASQRITNSITLDNDKNVYWKTVNASATVGFRQQSDDNFVFYSTNTAYGSRAVWSIFANSITSNMNFSVPANFAANVGFGSGAALYANGGPGTAGQVLSSNGTTIYWASPGAASVNVTAQYAWTNTHTFSANVSFTGNGIGIATNTGAIYLGGIADANWKIGRNTGVVTKWVYTNNTIDIITANSALEGFSIGLVNGNSYFETGYLGTFIASNVSIGNTSVNSTVNATTLSVKAILANASVGSSGDVLTSNGSAIYWTAAVAGVNVAAQYTWTNTQTFSNTITFGNATSNVVLSSASIKLGSNTDFIGDFSNATVVSRSNFTSSVTNGSTGIYALPNGTSGASSWQAANSSDPTNASKILIATNGSTDVQLVSGINGTGTYLPLSIYTGGVQQLQVNTSGSLFVNGSTNAASFTVGTGFTANATLVNAVSYISSTNTTTIGNAAYFVANGNFGVGTSTPTYKLQVNGSFAAITKSFVINHPTKPFMRLRYGSLEGPENGVYVRGRSSADVIELPDYWNGLVDENSITVNLTPIGKKQDLYVKEISNNTVIVGGSKTLDYFYTVFGERKDVEKLVVEF